MLLVFLKRYWRLLGALAILIGVFFAGRESVQMTTTETKTTDKVAEQVADDKTEHDTDVQKTDKVTTITKKPDGTTITQIVDHTKVIDKKTETDDSKTALKETKTTDTKTVTPVAAADSRYNLSLSVQNAISTKWNPDYQVGVGYRIIGPVWGNAIYDISTHSPAVGITVTFP